MPDIAGFYVSLIIMFLFGIFNTIGLNSSAALAATFPNLIQFFYTGFFL